jgi:Tat protein secretion system quality control protein TatD with DNase activity
VCSRIQPLLHLFPTAGIYPIDAACNVIKAETWGHPFPPPDKFDIEAEVAFIDRMCGEGKVVAVGECGLDAYYCTDAESLQEQERVLRLLIEGASGGSKGCVVGSLVDIIIIRDARRPRQRVRG